MQERDSGQRTTALVIALWRVPWIWRWFMQPAIVGPGGARPRRPPHRHTPPLRAHSGGGGRPAGVWWWDHGQCRGSDVRHGVVPVLGQRDQEGEDTGADENRRGHGSQRSKRRGKRGKREQMEVGRGDARAMHMRTKGAAPAMRGGPRGPYPGSHLDGSRADVRWKGRREEENNAPVQSYQVLHRTGLAHQDKVQTGRQTG